MWPNPQETVTFTEEILNGKLHFLCSDQRMESIQFDAEASKEKL